MKTAALCGKYQKQYVEEKMKQVAIFAVLMAMGMIFTASLASAGCNNGMALPIGAKVSSIIDKNTGMTMITVENVEDVQVYHYAHDGAVKVQTVSGAAHVNALDGRGFNFTFKHLKCANNPYALLTPDMVREAREAGVNVPFLGSGVGIDCGRPDGTCSFLITAK